MSALTQTTWHRLLHDRDRQMWGEIVPGLVTPLGGPLWHMCRGQVFDLAEVDAEHGPMVEVEA